MDEFMDNRFGYLRDKSLNELTAEREDLLEETNYLLELLEDKNVSSEEKSEIRNVDLKYLREKMFYVDELLKEYKSKKRM